MGTACRAYEGFKNHKGPNLIKENLLLEGINRDIVDEIIALYTDEMEKEAIYRNPINHSNRIPNSTKFEDARSWS